ncbi:hypothetical protein RYX36_036334, partial [Vicia faba]
TFLLPSSFDFVREEPGDAIEHVYSASQLSEAGLVFEVSDSKCLLDLNFDDKGVLKIPRFHVHDTTEIYMRNILAFEECHISDQDSCYISQYLSILDFLVNTEKDVSILVDKRIIVNWMGDANKVAAMVNNLCKNVSMPTLNSKYISICYRLNGFYENPSNKYKAIFVHEYFNTPWKIASTVTAVLLLLFTFIQASHSNRWCSCQKLHYDGLINRDLSLHKECHFWAPTFKWGISIANIADFSKPPDMISYPQQI